MKRASILIRIETELKQRLEERAAAENRSMSAHVIHLIERDLDHAYIPIEGAVWARTEKSRGKHARRSGRVNQIRNMKNI